MLVDWNSGVARGIQHITYVRARGGSAAPVRSFLSVARSSWCVLSDFMQTWSHCTATPATLSFGHHIGFPVSGSRFYMQDASHSDADSSSSVRQLHRTATAVVGGSAHRRPEAHKVSLSKGSHEAASRYSATATWCSVLPASVAPNRSGSGAGARGSSLRPPSGSCVRGVASRVGTQLRGCCRTFFRDASP